MTVEELKEILSNVPGDWIIHVDGKKLCHDWSTCHTYIHSIDKEYESVELKTR